MILDKFYEDYKLHRKYSIGEPHPEDSPLYEEEINKSEFEKKYTSFGINTEDMDGYYWQKLYTAQEKDYDLCVQVFQTFDLDFFFWFTTQFCEWFEDIIKKHGKLDLLEILRKHVYSFNESLAKERVDEIYNNSIKYCK